MRKGRRVLMMVPLPPPVHGASLMSRQLVQSRRLRENFRIRVIPLRFSRSLDSLEKFSLEKIARALLITLDILKELIFFRPALVYSVVTPAGYSHYRDLFWAFLQRLFRVPRLCHVRECGFNEGKTRFYRWRMRRMFAAAHVVVLSPLVRREVVSWVDEERIHVVPNGIPDDFPIRSKKESSRHGPPSILFLSNIMMMKGVFVLLEAATILRDRGIEFEIVMAGAFGRDVIPEDFSGRIRTMGLDPWIVVAGPADQKKKHELLNKADLFVFPTLREAFGNVLLEAMRAGIPVVASRIGSIPWIVEHGKTALLCREGDPRDLADKLTQMLTDPAARKRMGRAGRKRYEEMFTAEMFEKHMVAAMEQASAVGVKSKC